MNKFTGSDLLNALARRLAERKNNPLSTWRISAKIALDPETHVDAATAARIFDRWMREDVLPHERPVDIVSYRYPPFGPWVLLVCATGQYSLDARGWRPGLRYARRLPMRGSERDRVRAVVWSLAFAARLIEREAGARFLTDSIELAIDDRQTAPNTPETFSQLAKALEKYFGDLAPAAIVSLGAAEPRGLARAALRFENPLSLEQIAYRLGCSRLTNDRST